MLAWVAGVAACQDAREPTAAAADDSSAVPAAADSGAPAFDVSAQGTLPLPVDQSIGSSGVALGITQTGAGGAGSFAITNPRSVNQALMATTYGAGAALYAQVVGTGTGPAGVFSITNVNNVKPALGATSFGIGPAGAFTSNSHSPAANAVRATSSLGTTVWSQNIGVGAAGRFDVSSPDNPTSALWVATVGTGSAARFSVNHTGSVANAVDVATNGAAPGAAIHAVSGGTGRAGIFENTLASSPSPALEVHGAGLGGGLSVSSSNPTAATLYAVSLGKGPAGLFKGTTSGVSIITNGGTGLTVIGGGTSLFYGDVSVKGTLTKSAGSFRIDHPLDPEHKYLSHSFVESPDMMNVYNGNVALDSAGRATVTLPDWFEALNRDFRYQLTPIGAPGPNLYIAAGVSGNRFQIAGGRPYATVSWQVTGVRHDAYAEAHRIPVEEEKPAFGGAREHRGLESPRIDDSPDSDREHVRSNGTHPESLP
jgi:hypothetical protein